MAGSKILSLVPDLRYRLSMSLFCRNNSGAAWIYVPLVLIPCSIVRDPKYLFSINRVIRML